MCVLGECVIEADAGVVDAGTDAADAMDAADATDAITSDATSPDAGSGEGVEGCQCGSGAPSASGGLLACAVLLAIMRRRKGAWRRRRPGAMG